MFYNQRFFAYCHPRSCGGKKQKGNARLNTNKKMNEVNQIKTSPSLDLKKGKLYLRIVSKKKSIKTIGETGKEKIRLISHGLRDYLGKHQHQFFQEQM